jgi:hypothetical protein
MYQLNAQQVITNNEKNKKMLRAVKPVQKKSAIVDQIPTLIASLISNLKSKI